MELVPPKSKQLLYTLVPPKAQVMTGANLRRTVVKTCGKAITHSNYWQEPFHWSSSSHTDSSFKLICLAEDEKCWCKVLHSQPMCINIVCRLRFSWGELSFSSHSVPFEPTKFTNFFLITMFHRKEMYIYFLTNICLGNGGWSFFNWSHGSCHMSQITQVLEAHNSQTHTHGSLSFDTRLKSNESWMLFPWM